LVVKLKSGRSIKGNYVSATDVAIRLSEGKRISEMGRDEIARIQLVVRRKSYEKAEAIGAGAGAAFGVWIAFLGDEYGSPSAGAVVLVALIFAGIGHRLAQVFSPKYKRVVIYEAQK
jgi:hypothetical protein